MREVRLSVSIPRPPKTPEALRSALAELDPGRLAEMAESKDDAFALAAQTGNIGHIHAWVIWWASVVEVERRTDLRTRMRQAEHLTNTLDHNDPRWQSALSQTLAIMDEAKAAVEE
ncbi:hypothetical protein [Streptacidiphilus sp. EB103A]|uniref:hypothetical protein n=1 Tax=Streptacidiphilus sp. EB103A TaxID=3156275 RepID=UPI0035117486